MLSKVQCNNLHRIFFSSSSGEKFGRDCRVISVNFADGMDVYHAISKQLSGLDIGVLGMLA